MRFQVVEYNSDGLPYCPDCGEALLCESAGNRDTETMAGLSVEYYNCEKCNCSFYVVLDSVYGDEIYPCDSH